MDNYVEIEFLNKFKNYLDGGIDEEINNLNDNIKDMFIEFYEKNKWKLLLKKYRKHI